MATIIVSSSKKLSEIVYAQGDELRVKNGATLTVDSTSAVRPGSLRCTTSGRVLFSNDTGAAFRFAIDRKEHDFIIQGSAVIEGQGAPIVVGTGTGSALSINISGPGAPASTAALTDVTLVAVEQTPGAGDWKTWPVIPIAPSLYHIGRTYGSAAKAEFPGSDVEGKVAFWDQDSGELSFGDGVNGTPVPTGCRIAVPNILIDQGPGPGDSTDDIYIVSEGTPTSGTFSITVHKYDELTKAWAVHGTTTDLPYNATAAAIQAAVAAITGATVTATGGPLPTAVRLYLTGVALNSHWRFVVNSNVTGGTNSVIYAREYAGNNLSLINLNAGGTIVTRWVMFGSRIWCDTSTLASADLEFTGFGSNYFRMQNTNNNIRFNNVSWAQPPFYVQGNLSQVVLVSIGGSVRVEDCVLSSRRGASGIQIQAAPGLDAFDRNTFLSHHAAAKVTGNRNMIALTNTKPGVPRRDNAVVGGRVLLTNEVNNLWTNLRLSHGIYQSANATSATNAIATVNSQGQVFAYPMSSAGAPISSTPFSISDAASGDITVIGGVLKGGGGPASMMWAASKGVELRGTVMTDIKGAAALTFDAPASSTESDITLSKVFVSQTPGFTIGVECSQRGRYDLVTGTVAGPATAAVGVNDYYGGNFTDPGLTPTTGHVRFGPFGPGDGWTSPSGSSYSDGAGRLLTEEGGRYRIQIPFTMHGITGFQSVWPTLWGWGAGWVAPYGYAIAPGLPAGGTFTLSFYSNTGTLLGTTSALAFNATAATVQAAVRAAVASWTTAVVAGTNIGTGYTITYPTGVSAVCRADGALLSGGDEPGIAYGAGGSIQAAGCGGAAGQVVPLRNLQFQVRPAGGSWSPLADLTPANLAAVTGLDPALGLEMAIEIQTEPNDKAFQLSTLAIPTTVNPSAWQLSDSSVELVAVGATDVIELRLASDNSLLATFTGYGRHDFSVGVNHEALAYWVRKNAAGIELMRTQATPFRLSLNDSGAHALAAGAEVQLAQVGQLGDLAGSGAEVLELAMAIRDEQVAVNSI